MAAYAYIRATAVEQAIEYRAELDRQRRMIEATAQLAGVQLTRVFEELGGSARKLLASRPVGTDLLASLMPGDTIVVAGLRHAFISAPEALTTAGKWKHRGVEMIVAELGPEPVTRDGVSRLLFGMLRLVADLRRVRANNGLFRCLGTKANGRDHLKSDLPLGWQVRDEGDAAHLVSAPGQRAALESLQEMTAAGVGLRGIAEEIEKRLGLRASSAAPRKARRVREAEATAPLSTEVYEQSPATHLRSGGADVGDPVLTQGEAAARLRISTKAIYRLRRAGHLRYLPGRPIKVLASDIERLIRDGLVKDPAPKPPRKFDAEARVRMTLLRDRMRAAARARKP